MRNLFFLTFLLLASCAHRSLTGPDRMSSIQLLDRNGFSETISLRDRLTSYEKIDFSAPQPYQKVVRIYGKASVGKTASKLTTYHPNGAIWQYLEILNGRAHGAYREWHANGQLKISAFVIEGVPDVNEVAQMSWLFDDLSVVFDNQGNKTAEIPYSKGELHGTSYYYFPSGEVMKEIPYQKNEIEGTFRMFNQQRELIESTPYVKGAREGLSTSYWQVGKPKSEELYENGLLTTAQYFDIEGRKIAEIQNGNGQQAIFQEEFVSTLLEYQKGKVEGKIQNFNPKGSLTSIYYLQDGLKTGEEWEYYPSNDGSLKPKLHLHWHQDTIQGVVKTWYPTGVLESQREIHNNKKHGLSFAWYEEGDLMLLEEYENDTLVKGSYFKKWEKQPASKIENGKGIATLFDKEGRCIRKIPYEKGLPQNDS